MSLKYVLLLSLFLTACASKGQWEHGQIRGDSNKFCSARLSSIQTFHSEGLQLELVRIDQEQKGYLCLHSGRLENPFVKIYFKKKKDSFSDQATRHEGGQRFSLSPTTTTKIIQALLAGSEVKLLLLGKESILKP